jgi:hypothetical protein
MTTDITHATPAAIQRIQTPAAAAYLAHMAKAAAVFYSVQGMRDRSQTAKAIYIRAARRAGELMLPENTPRSNGGRPNSSHDAPVSTPYQEACDGAGITRHTALTWQKLAEIPDIIFENYLVNPKYKLTEYTFVDLFKYSHAPGGGVVITLESLAEKMINLIHYARKAFPDDGPELFRTLLEREL